MKEQVGKDVETALMMTRTRMMMMTMEQVGKLVAFISSLVRGNAVEPEVRRVFLHQFV